ncbi:GNAT family N-acetyltransferase [Streptomyces sp. ISL-99]|uniref:GNAT family N-acetyltransferase n=1 Tax=Streptomyces sp. ISL-99 TaxID=2819193 RepID=UPI0020365BAC|nr:GNAT family N-acetyltransferase [Streptomyces sp. ISL-99]
MPHDSAAAYWWPASLTTSRLALRPIESSDVPEIARLWTDPEVRRYLGGPVAQQTVRERRNACVGAPGALSVVRQEDGVVVGLVTVERGGRDGRTEVSYQFLPEYWGCGYAREAVAAAVDWASAEVPSQFPGVVAVTQEANGRSRHLLEALGATLVDSFVEWQEPQVLYAFH